MIGLITVPLVVAVLARPTLNLKPGCLFAIMMNFFRVFPTILSLITVWLIAVDRYYAILKKRLHVQYATTRGISTVLCCEVIVAFIWSYLHPGQWISLVVLGVLKAFVFITICVIYYHILEHVRSTAKRTRESFHDISVRPVYDHTLCRISLLVSVSLIVCYLPSTLANLYMAYTMVTHTRNIRTLYYLEAWSILPMYVNSGINGVLFIYRNRKLRRWTLKLYKHLFCFDRTPMSPVRLARRDAMVVDKKSSLEIQKVVFAFNSTWYFHPPPQGLL